MNDEFAHGAAAGHGAPGPQRVQVWRTRSGVGGRVLRWWLFLSLAAALALGACVALGLHQVDLAPVHVIIDGEDFSNIAFDGLGNGALVLLVLGAVLVLLLVLLLLPVFLALVLGGVALAIACAVVLPLLAVGLVLAAATSPLWLVALLVWLAVRRRPMPSATMPA